MEFEVRFKDDDVVWKPWDLDLSSCQPFVDYSLYNKELYLLLFATNRVAGAAAAITSNPITELQPGDTILLDLPDKYHIKYVEQVHFTR